MCCPRFYARLHPSAVRVRIRSRSTSVQELDIMLKVNVRGVFFAIQAAAHLSEGGRIITVGSNTAVRSGYLVRVHKGVFFSGVARAERHERDGRRVRFAHW
jgi:NAD(P)-dependent dehydrogenase (short-subunit alcohol dehydrogenase family)